MVNTGLSPHESLEIHELLNQELLAIKKINASLEKVKDAELKGYMQEVINAKKTGIKEMESALSSQINA